MSATTSVTKAKENEAPALTNFNNNDKSTLDGPSTGNGININGNHNNNVTSHKPPAFLIPPGQGDLNKKPPILSQTGPAFGEAIEGLRSIDSVSSQDTSIHRESEITSISYNNNNNNNVHNYEPASQPLPRGMPEIKVRPQDATEFVRNHSVRRAESSRLMKPSNTFPSATSPSPLAHSATLPNSSSLGQQHSPPLSNSPKIKLSLKYSTRTLMLSVIAHRTRNLQESPHTSLPSPYVKTYLIENFGTSNRRVDHSKRKSKIIRNTVNPVFEEALEYFMPPRDIRLRRIELSVCSDNGVFGRNIVLGRCLINLAKIHSVIIDKSKDPNREDAVAETTVTDWHSLSPAELEYDLDGSSSVANGNGVARSPSTSSTAPGSTMLTRKTRKLSGSRGSLN